MATDLPIPSYVVRANRPMHSSSFKDIWAYRELLFLLIRRDFISAYKQTALGPLWFVVQPVANALVFTLVFGLFVGLPTGAVPPFIFFMAGTIIWSLFANSVNKVSSTFISSTSLFQKVYFPRLIIPLSLIFTNLLNFLVQLLIFFVFVLIFWLRGSPIELSAKILLLPIVWFQAMTLGLGVGCIIASWTVRYRDLQMAVGFGMQLWMYGSCVIYPRSAVPEHLQWLLTLNPMAAIVECFRNAILGGRLDWVSWGISLIVTLLIAIIGIWLFGKSEGTATDSV